jgi:hypothetical protein
VWIHNSGIMILVVLAHSITHYKHGGARGSIGYNIYCVGQDQSSSSSLLDFHRGHYFCCNLPEILTRIKVVDR